MAQTDSLNKAFVFRTINAILLQFLVSFAFCQDNNNYILVAGGATNFDLSTAVSLENVQTNSNAISITVKSKNTNYDLYAMLYGYSSSNGVVLPSNLLALKLNSVNPSQSANYNTITLGSSNQLLDQGSTKGNKTVTYMYDLMLNPIGYDYPPGNYNVSILFTLTQP